MQKHTICTSCSKICEAWLSYKFAFLKPKITVCAIP